MHLFGKDSPLKRRAVIIIDEAHYSAGARSWYETVQKDLMNSIAAIRSKGYMIVIISLHLDMLDKIIRKFVLSYMIHMEKRGVGTVYRLYTPRFESEMHKYRLGQVVLKLPEYESCPHKDCLECEFLHSDDPCIISRAIYERRKKEFIDSKIDISQKKQEEKLKKEKVLSASEFAKLIVPKYTIDLEQTSKGSIDFTSIQDIASDKLGYNIGINKAMAIGRIIKRDYPNILAKVKKRGRK